MSSCREAGRVGRAASLPAPLAEETASAEQVQRAVAALSDAELIRLRGYARFRMRAFGGTLSGKGAEDLLADALVATLAQQRRWRPAAVDLVGHLSGVMRSLSSHWAEQQETGLTSLDGGWERLPADAGGRPDAALSARQQLELVERRFADDGAVLDLIGAYARGLTGPEIKVELGWTQTEMETVARRLRRGVEKMGMGEGL